MFRLKFVAAAIPGDAVGLQGRRLLVEFFPTLRQLRLLEFGTGSVEDHGGQSADLAVDVMGHENEPNGGGWRVRLGTF